MVVKRIVKDKDCLIQEVSLMAIFIGHPNIAQIVGYDDIKGVILIKLCSQSSLNRWIRKAPSRKIRTLHRFLENIAQAIKAMHDLQIVHNDIITQNILLETVDEHLVCKLADFGYATVGN